MRVRSEQEANVLLAHLLELIGSELGGDRFTTDTVAVCDWAMREKWFVQQRYPDNSVTLHHANYSVLYSHAFVSKQ